MLCRGREEGKWGVGVRHQEGLQRRRRRVDGHEGFEGKGSLGAGLLRWGAEGVGEINMSCCSTGTTSTVWVPETHGNTVQNNLQHLCRSIPFISVCRQSSKTDNAADSDVGATDTQCLTQSSYSTKSKLEEHDTVT